MPYTGGKELLGKAFEVVGYTFGTAAVPMRVHRRGGTLFIALLLTMPVTLPPRSNVAAVAGEVGDSGRKS